MAEPMNRRALLSGLVGAGLGLAVAAPADAAPDRQLGALDRLIGKLGRAVEDLDGIRTDWVPLADEPSTRVALAAIITQANFIIFMATDLGTRTR